MNELVFFWIGLATGISVTWLLCRPMKHWEEGYNTAKETYNNWNLGFKDGFNAAMKHMGGVNKGE